MNDSISEALLWPLGDHWPAAATAAVLGALSQDACRRMRATCRSARAAVDSHTNGINISVYEPIDVFAGLTPARFPVLTRVVCTGLTPAACAPLGAALRALAPQLEELKIGDGQQDDVEDGEPLPTSLPAAIAGCTRLRALDISVVGPSAAFVEALAQLPALTRLRAMLQEGIRGDEDKEWEPELCRRVSFEQLEEVLLFGWGPACITLARELAMRSSLPRLRSLSAEVGGPRAPAAIWAAPWLTQLTRLTLELVGAGNCLLHGIPACGLELPLLQWLEIHPSGDGHADEEIGVAEARRLAACRLPALRIFSALALAPGAAEVLPSAPWAAGISHLTIGGCWCVITPASAAALRAAPLLQLRCLRLWLTELAEEGEGGGGGEAAALELSSLLASVLSSPWAASLPTLETHVSIAARALATAPLPGLRSLTLSGKVEPIDTVRLSLAKCLSNIEELYLHCWDGGPGVPGAYALATLQLPRLHTFRMSCTAGLVGGAEALRFLGAAPWLPALRFLGLSWPEAEGDGCRAVIEDPSGPFQALRRSGAAVAFGDEPW